MKLGQFRKAPVVDKDAKERAKKLEPVIREVIDIINESDYPVGEYTWEEGEKRNSEIAKKLLACYLENNIKLTEVSLINQYIKKVFDEATNAVVDSLNTNLTYVEKNVWGCRKDEVDFETFDKVIKEVAGNDENLKQS